MDESPCTSPRTTRWADTGLAEISHEQASHKLFRAVMQENISQLAQLLDDGAMLNIVNAANLTPIELAAERGKANSLAFLALRGPDYLKAQYHDFVFHEDDSPNTITGKVFSARRAKIEVEVAATQFELETAEPVEVSRLLQLLELTLKSGGQSRRSIERLLSFTGDFAAAMNSLDTVVYERQANETFGRAKPLVTAALWETLPCPGPGFPRGEMLANDIGAHDLETLDILRSCRRPADPFLHGRGGYRVPTVVRMLEARERHADILTGVCDWSVNASEGHDDGEVANSAAPSAWFPELNDDLADTEVIEITNEVEDQEIEFEAEATGPPQQLHAEKRPSTAAAVMDAGSEPGSQPSSPDQPNAHSIQSDPNSVEATSWGSLETDASAQQVEVAPRGAFPSAEAAHVAATRHGMSIDIHRQLWPPVVPGPDQGGRGRIGSALRARADLERQVPPVRMYRQVGPAARERRRHERKAAARARASASSPVPAAPAVDGFIRLVRDNCGQMQAGFGDDVAVRPQGTQPVRPHTVQTYTIPSARAHAVRSKPENSVWMQTAEPRAIGPAVGKRTAGTLNGFAAESIPRAPRRYAGSIPRPASQPFPAAGVSTSTALAMYQQQNTKTRARRHAASRRAARGDTPRPLHLSHVGQALSEEA